MKHSQLIRKAKKSLSRHLCCGRESWVCEAIKSSAVTDEDRKNANQIIKNIQRAIGGSNYTVLHWLQSQEIDDHEATPEQIQDYRLRWMDAMINKYERAGK